MRISIEQTYSRKLNKSKLITVIIVILLLIVLLYRLYYENRAGLEVLGQTVLSPLMEDVEQKTPKEFNITQTGMENIDNIYNSKEKVVYLTFDDGPSADITPKILELLKQEDVKATFFVLGSIVNKNPEVLKQIYKQGHYIANHGYSHVYSKIYDSPEAVLEEYEKTEKAIRKALDIENYNSNLFRFPGGSVGGGYDEIKSEAKKLLEENMIPSLDWNALTRDSEGYEDYKDLVKNAKSTIKDKNSVVILMHDAAGKDLSYEALKDIITYLKDEGYTFGDMHDLIV